MDNKNWNDCLNEEQENIELAIKFYRNYSCTRNNYDEELEAAKSYKNTHLNEI